MIGLIGCSVVIELWRDSCELTRAVEVLELLRDSCELTRVVFEYRETLVS